MSDLTRLRVAIAGAAGRMGRALIAAVASQPDWSLLAATERPGVDASAAPCPVFADPATAAAGADVWIDFTTPDAALAALSVLPGAGVRAAVIGATGFTPEQQAAVVRASAKISVVQSGNFSLGVAVLCALAERAASALDAGWDIEILEAHHRHKVDAPSGTALMIGHAAAAGRGAALDALRLPPHAGGAGPRRQGGIGFAVVRAGGLIGAHSALFASARETLTISHEALDRGVFADGALAAARWAVGQPPGLYGMRDVLGF